jgi:hypothetical protein
MRFSLIFLDPLESSGYNTLNLNNNVLGGTMKKMALLTIMTLSTLAQANELTIPGEKWLAKFTGFICAAYTDTVAAPTEFAKINVKFEQITTDSTLDNALLKATFEQDGKTCRYNSIISADNTAQTYELVQSIAYDVNGKTAAAYKDCNAGKAVIDNAFKATNKYLYYGHPHNLAFMLPNTGAENVCGAGAEMIGANFVVSGIIKP